MDNQDIKKAGKGILKNEIATRSTDPNFYGALTFLPNPDVVLRKMGKQQDVFDAIILDSHVIGDLRSVRSGLLAWESRLQAGGEDAADLQALELCELFMDARPAPGMQWSDIIWSMAQAVFRGFKVHEVVWKRDGRFLMPDKIVDRPNKRFVFGIENELRLLTRDKPTDGEPLNNYKMLVTRHMHSYENPYGLALLSSCFWPYTFKHNGFRYFTKFCEKYGIPWAIGKYPQGTALDEQNELADRLADMVEDGVAAIPADGSVELLSYTSSGQLPQERLIQTCNSEMSKALTSQTLATEIQGNGSRAASETHREREQSVNESDRHVICDTFNQLFEWITELNFPDAKPPTFEFYEEAEARQEWVEVLDKARNFINIPASFAHERLQIPLAEKGEDVLPSGGAPQTPGAAFNRCPSCGGYHEFAEGDTTQALTEQAATQADDLLKQMTKPVRDLLERVNTVAEFRDGLAALSPDMDETKLGEMTVLAMMTGLLDGMNRVKEDV